MNRVGKARIIPRALWPRDKGPKEREGGRGKKTREKGMGEGEREKVSEGEGV